MSFPFSIQKFCSVALGLAITMSAGTSWAQLLQQNDEPGPPPKNVALAYPIGELEAMTLEQLNAELTELTPGFRESLKSMWTAKARYGHADKADSYGYGKTWRENAIRGQQAYQKVKELSLEIYLRAEDPTEEQFKLAFQMALASIDEGRVGVVHRVLKKMLKQRPEDEDLWTFAGRVAVFTDDYKTAERLLRTKPKLIEDLPKEHQILFESLDRFAERWPKEKEIRQAEDAADDLPRVELTTSKGKIVIELFENEAPDTVGNFIHLVESGFYKHTFFYPVLRHFRAQTGLYFEGEQSVPQIKPTDYSIIDESNEENARGIFRGSIATVPSDNTAGAAQFSIYSAPSTVSPSDSNQTVFGRVISGMDVVDLLKVNSRFNKDTGVSEQIKPSEGDMPDDYIVSAKVLRKRPSVIYQPKKRPTSKK